MKTIQLPTNCVELNSYHLAYVASTINLSTIVFESHNATKVWKDDFEFTVRGKKVILNNILQYTPPRTGVFKPIRTDGTFDRWPKKIATQSSTWKNPYRDFDPKKQSLQYRGEIPIRTFFGKSISPILGQSLEVPQHRAHIHINFEPQSLHTPQRRVTT